MPEKTPYEGRPPLEAILNTYDLESVARENVTHEAWCYLNSAGDDEVSFRENTKAFHRIWLRPRILRDVKHCDPQTVVFGNQRQRVRVSKSSGIRGSGHDHVYVVIVTGVDVYVVTVTGVDARGSVVYVEGVDEDRVFYPLISFLKLPIYVSATALGKLYDPEGEVAITRGVGKLGVTQMAPTLASCSMAEMAKARVSPEQLMWYQLYVNPSREITRRVIKQAEDLGYRGLFVTVDAPQLGRRERDMRNKAPLTSSVQVEGGPAHCSLTAPYSSVLRRWTRR